jgi:hypothetical protein
MATFDISRVAFDPRKHYASVRMQQGRVLTDDDWNENERIEEEEERRTQVDIIGPSGSPDEGFKIGQLTTTDGVIDFDIHGGTIYLGGLRLEMQSTETFRLQKDWLQKDDAQHPIPSPNDLPPGQERFDLVFLEAWQQPVSAVEDSALFEAALGGPDTTTRVRNMRRVKLFPNTNSSECAVSWLRLQKQWSDNHLGSMNDEHERNPNIKLQVSFSNEGPAEDLCSPPVAGGYLGAENQAVRVQLTRPDRFTWGFDNAAPLYRIQASGGSTTVEMITEPRDQYHWPLAGQIVEILPWSSVLPNREKVSELSGFLSRVTASYNPDTGSFTLATPLPAGFGKAWTNRSDKDSLALPEEFLFMRVWNRGPDLASPEEIPFVLDTPVPLGHTGLQVTFSRNDSALEADPVPDDFWVIAVRPETPAVLVPWDLNDGITPHGVHRFFAPLAMIRWANTNGQITGEIIHDCRKKFNPLTEQECCCTYTVGDGVNSKGDFSSIEDAVASLPEQGGKICVLPGIHDANVIIRRRRQIHIIGCGEQSIVRPRTRTGAAPIFHIENSQKICLENLTLFTAEGIAVEVKDEREGQPSEEITIKYNRILALVHAIYVAVQPDKAGSNDIKILYNQIGQFDKPEGKAIIFTLADDVLIERNRLILVPPPANDPDDPRGDEPEDGVFDPCFQLERIYENNRRFRLLVANTLRYVLAYIPSGRFIGYVAQGGIQVGCASDQVYIRQNTIIGGRGNGILLGHFPVQEGEEVFDPYFPAIRQVCIQENCIYQMGISGIGVFSIIQNRVSTSRIHTNDITIYRNKIRNCALQVPVERDFAALAFGGIILAFCETGIIGENRIEDNGRSHLDPICGIFILHGEKIDIFGNRILNNGPSIETTDNQPRQGARGGVVIRMSFQSLDFSGFVRAGTSDNQLDIHRAGLPFFEAVPAVKLHDNIITQPLGQAVFLMAFGPVSVVSNQFTSQGIDRTNIYARLAASIFIMNLGLSKDLFGMSRSLYGKTKSLPLTNPASAALRTGAISPLANRVFQLLPSGKIMFTANQTTLDLRSNERSIGISSQMIVTLDDVAFNNNQSECAALLAIPEGAASFDIVLLNTFLLGVSVRSNDNRFTDGFTLTLFSLFSYGIINTAAQNQATHCLIIIGFPPFEIDVNNLILIATNCRDQARAVGTNYGKRTKASVVNA